MPAKWSACRPALHEKASSDRHQRRVMNERAGEDAAKRSPLRGNLVDGTGEVVEEVVVELADRLLQAVVAKVVVSKHAHPLVVIALETVSGRITGGKRLRRDARGQATGLHR